MISVTMNSPWAMHASMGRNPQLTSRLRCLVQLLLRVQGYVCRGYVAVYTETYYWAHSPWNHKGLVDLYLVSTNPLQCRHCD